MEGVFVASDPYADYTKDRGYNTGVTRGSYKSSYADFVTAFHDHLQKWKSETVFESNLDNIVSHPDYQAITRLGARVVPLILNELRTEPSLLVFMLEDITGEKPYATNIQGDIRAMSDHWVLWMEREAA